MWHIIAALAGCGLLLHRCLDVPWSVCLSVISARDNNGTVAACHVIGHYKLHGLCDIVRCSIVHISPLQMTVCTRLQ